MIWIEREPAYLIIEATAHGSVSAAALVKEGDERLLRASSFVTLNLLATTGEELEGGI